MAVDWLTLASRRVRWLLGPVALVMVVGSCGLPGDSGYIVYTVGPEGSRDIGVVRPDGTQNSIIVGGASDDYAPVWSPDRKRIAFLSNRSGNVEIHLVNSDGSLVVQATDSAVPESQPTWSPDGRSLAFVSPTPEGRPHVFVADLTDLVPRRLTFGTPAEKDPAWSPDGRWIAFTVLDEAGNPLGIFIRNPNGVNRIQITQGPDYQPAWSPDGKRLAFVSNRDGNPDVYAVAIQNGTSQESPAVRLTADPAEDYAPAWSPNGRRIAFLSNRQGNADIFTVSPTGDDLLALTTNHENELAFDFGPDGQIVFISDHGGTPGLFTMRDDGKEQRVVLRSDTPYSSPDW